MEYKKNNIWEVGCDELYLQWQSWVKMVGHALRRRRRERESSGGSGAEPPEIFLGHALYFAGKRPLVNKNRGNAHCWRD